MQEQTKRYTFEENVLCGKEKMIFEVIYFVEKSRMLKNWKYSKLNMDFLLRKQFPFLEKEGI